MENKHSGIGIASFVISIATGVFTFLLMVVAGVMEVSTPGGIDENSVEAVVTGLFLIALLLLDLVALGLGVGGLLQKDRRKLLAVLGTVFSATTLFLTLCVMLIGLASG